MSKIIVVGAGMGGLTAALDLSAGGHDVTLLERHAAPGGKLREIEVGGRGIDSGPTVFTMRWVFDDLFRDAGLDFERHVELASADVLARHSWPDGDRLDLYTEVERSAEAIAAFTGAKDAEAYRRFARKSQSIFETLDHSFMRRDKPGPVELSLSLGLRGLPRLAATKPFVSLWRELGSLFTDQRLRQLFARYATYCGSSPFDAPATLMLIAHAERAGVWCVSGGMQRLAEAVAEASTKRGADLRFGNGVAKISTQRNASFEVVLDDESVLEADAVVFNGDVAALEKGRLGTDTSNAQSSRTREARSLSAITWSAISELDDFPLAHHNVFFGSDYRAEFSAIFDSGSICDQPTVYVCAQDRGAGRSRPDGEPERLFVLINAPPTELGDDVVARAQNNAFELLHRQGLTIDLAATPHARQLPQDFDKRFPDSQGAIYGWPTHGWFGSFRRGGATTKIPGLFCAGGTVHPGPGVPMAALSGRIAARAALSYLS